MNSTASDSINTSNSTCILENRVYTASYLFFKLINSTYLRLLIGPGILLNTLCLIVLSRPRLSNKSTTIIFLRFLALFDILAITLKYIRAEMNYQSTEKVHEVFLMTPRICKILYILMNSSISMSMWTIVLMSLDKAIAVTYPLKSSIWLTHKRVVYICCGTIVVLFLANLSFTKLSGIRTTRFERKYCALNKGSITVDLLTASMLPMGLITGANLVIALVLRRVSRASVDCRTSEESDRRDSDQPVANTRFSVISTRYGPSGGSISSGEIISATRRRTSVQVTRMLLAVTLSLIICNIPNTIYFVVVKFYDTSLLVHGRECEDVSDDDIKRYQFGFYSSVIQDILSDLPHIVNFFLYCLAGRKFRSIFINEVNQFLFDLHLIRRREQRSTHGGYPMKSELTSRTNYNSRRERSSSITPMVKTRKTVEVLFNGKTNKTLINEDNQNLLNQKNSFRFNIDESQVRPYRNLK